MKKLKYLLVPLVVTAIALTTFGGSYFAATFMQNNGVTGSSTAFFGSTNGATFYVDDTYNTNRQYTYFENGVLQAAVTPLATNSVSGAIYPTFSRSIRIPDIAGGGLTTNVALSVFYTRGAGHTNTTTLSFVRSANNAQSWDTNTPFVVTLTMPTSAADPATVVTNVPPWFLIGASHIRLWRVVAGTNTQVGGVGASPYSTIIVNANLSGFSQ